MQIYIFVILAVLAISAAKSKNITAKNKFLLDSKVSRASQRSR